MIEWTIRETLAAHPDAGVALWAPRRVRDVPGLQVALSKVGGDGNPSDPEAAQLLEALSARLAQDMAQERDRGVKRLIISEENFLGSMRRNLFEGRFYMDVARRLTCLDSLLPQSPDMVAMGLREYGAVWTSAYQYSAQKRKKLPPVADAAEGLMARKRGWPAVIEDVRSVWPNCGLCLWQQETLGDNLRRITAALTGLPEDDVVVPSGQINARKSKGPQPELFDPQGRKHLSQRYRRHLRRMRAQEGVVWADGEDA